MYQRENYTFVYNDVLFFLENFSVLLRKHVFNQLIFIYFSPCTFSCLRIFCSLIMLHPIFMRVMLCLFIFFPEIYRIVSQKQLPEGPAGGGRPGGGEAIHIDGTHPESSSGKKPCCNN